MTYLHNIENDSILEMPRSPKRKPVKFIPLGLSVVSGCLFGLAATKLSSETGVTANLGALLLTAGATIVAYGVQTVANDVGAKLAARRSYLAGTASVLALLSVGSALTVATYAGRVLPDVDRIQIQEHGSALSRYVGTVNSHASEADRISAMVRSVGSDLERWAACERRESCISQHNTGGHGSISKLMSGQAARARDIADTFKDGQASRELMLEDANRRLQKFDKLLGNDDFLERRAELKAQDALLEQDTTKIARATPVELVQRYAQELTTGVRIAGRSDVQRKINAILSGHGRALQKIIDALPIASAQRPAFPEKPGVSDALSHWMKFIPLLAIVAAIDLVFPLLNWAVEYKARRFEVINLRARRAQYAAQRRRDETALRERQSAGQPPLQNGQDDRSDYDGDTV